MTSHLLEHSKMNIASFMDDSKPDIETVKRRIVDQSRLITFFILVSANSEYPFKKLVKQFETLKVAIAKLECFKDIDFFAWFLLHKMQDKSLKQFKVAKVGEGL
jgi:hypothetical protein